MGFELKLINNAITYLHVSSIEQTIEYLSKVDGKWSHPFVDFELDFNNNNIVGKKNSETFKRCQICEDKISNHNSPKNSSTNLLYNNNNTNSRNVNALIPHDYQSNQIMSNHSLDIKFIELGKKASSFNSFKNSNFNINNKISNDSIQEPESICEICQGEINDPYDLQCKHIFCRDCVKEYIINKINNSDVFEIECPLGKAICKVLIEESNIKLLILENDFLRYKKFLKRTKISKIPNAVFCPILNCDSYTILKNNDERLNENQQDIYQIDNNLDIENNIKEDNRNEIDLKIIEVVKIDESQRNDINRRFKEIELKNTSNNNECFLYCIDNNHYFCLKCKSEAHPGQKCDLKQEIEFNKAIKDLQHVKRCPKCGFYIQKNQGCNHMTCANLECKYEFCWICLEQYTGNHFSNIRSSCYGLMSVDQNSLMIRYPVLRFFYKIFNCIFAFILLPIFLLLIALVFISFLASILLIYIYNNYFKIKCFNFRSSLIKKATNLVALGFFFNTGIFLFPLISLTFLFFLLALPCVFVIFCCWCLMRWELRRNQVIIGLDQQRAEIDNFVENNENNENNADNQINQNQENIVLNEINDNPNNNHNIENSVV